MLLRHKRNLSVIRFIAVVLLLLSFIAPLNGYASIGNGKITVSGTDSYLIKKSLDLLKRNKVEHALKRIHQSRNRHAISYIRWKIYLGGYNSSYDFNEIAGFINRHREWPRMD